MPKNTNERLGGPVMDTGGPKKKRKRKRTLEKRNQMVMRRDY